MDHDISLGFLLKILKKTWWKLLLIALTALIAVSVFVQLAVPKKYSSSIDFYVVNINTSYDYTTSSLLSATPQLINDYISIIKSDQMLNRVATELVARGYRAEQITIRGLRSMIQSETENETSVFRVTLAHSNKAFAYEVASIITELAPTVVTEIAKPDSLTHESLADKVHTVISYYNQNMVEEGGARVELSEKEISDMLKNGFVGIPTQLNCIEVITPPVEDTAADSPDVIKYGLLGAVAAAVAAYLFFLIRHMFELRVTSEEDVKNLLNRPLIGAIPHWETPSGRK